MILGIDPGQNGGLAILGKDRVIYYKSVMPILAKELDYKKLVEPLTNYQIEMVYMEKVGAMPKQGVTSMFNFGKHYGELLGVINMLSLPHVLVRPTEWQNVAHKGMSRKIKPKERSLKVATDMYPDTDLRKSNRAKIAHDGIVDAILIALYGVKDYYLRDEF